MLYVYLLFLFFGSTTKPIIKNIGKGEEFSQLKGLCQDGTRSHMQMLVKLIDLGEYKVALLKEWIFGNVNKGRTNAESSYNFKIDGKSVKLSGKPYFTGMYTYSPTFVAIYKKSVKWDYISSDSCEKSYTLKYPGMGFYLLNVGSKDYVNPCNIMSINTVSVKIAPLFETKKEFLFFIKAEDTTQDSIRVIVAREGKLQKSFYIKSGYLYIGVMDNTNYDIQVGNLDINLPQALRLLEQ